MGAGATSGTAVHVTVGGKAKKSGISARITTKKDARNAVTDPNYKPPPPVQDIVCEKICKQIDRLEDMTLSEENKPIDANKFADIKP